MSARESAEAHVNRLVRAAVVPDAAGSDTTPLADRCFPNLQTPQGSGAERRLQFPACVYQALGGDQLTTFGDGPRQRTVSLRLDFRSRDYSEAVGVAGAAVASLRSGGRLRSLAGPLDIYDGEADIHRRLWTAEVVA